MAQFVCRKLLPRASDAVLPVSSSYPQKFPQTSQVATALYRTNCLCYTLSVADSSDLLRNEYSRFGEILFDSERSDLWLWEDEDEEELGNRLTRTSEDSEDVDQNSGDRFNGGVDASDGFIARKLQECSKQIGGTGRLAHLTSATRIQFLTWLFIVGMSFVDSSTAVVSLQETIMTWVQSFDHDPPVSHDTWCGCDPGAIKDWVNVVLQVYSVADLRLMSGGSVCDCLDVELASRAIELQTNSVEVHPVFCRWVFKMFIPAWPSILWVLFRMLLPDEPKPVMAFLSLLREEQHRDLFAWDRKDRVTLSGELEQNLKIGPFIRDWRRYVSEIDSQTWNTISSLTRVSFQSSACRDSGMRICAFTLMLGMSPSIPQPIADAFNIDVTSKYWVQFANIASEAYAREPQLLLQRIQSQQFWSASQLNSALKRAALDRCFDIFHTSGYTALERVEFISFILTDHEVGINSSLFAFSPAIRYSSPTATLEWLRLTRIFRYVKDRHFSKILSFRSDFKWLLKFLRAEIQRYKVPPDPHLWAFDLSSHVVECFIYLAARLAKSLQNRDGYDTFLEYRGTEAQEMLDLLQDLLDLELFSVIRPMLFKAMRRLSRASNLYPHSFTLTGLQKVGTQVAGGGYGDIWQGLVGGESVCIKMLRIFQESDIAMAVKEFGAEALIWRQLCHPNVLPFFGLYYIEERLCLISPWMRNGNIMEFLKANSPDTQKRFSMILDVASGLEYLHNQNIIHGDLKGINILVTPSERACIADFGLSIIVNTMTLRLATSTTTNHRGTARYHAPELFGETAVKTFASDIYAFGCVAYEIMTGKVPFRKLCNDMQIMFCVLNGKRPERLPSCTGTPALDSFWELLAMCWEGDKARRPNAAGITTRLSEAPITTAMTPVESADWDDQFTARFRRSINMEPLLPSVNQLERMIFGEGETRLLLFFLDLIIPEEVAKGMKRNTTQSTD
ncbi:kinase domain-containing protein [Favolaschia claudopus]|uniref:Kinase domain-containing protein n=1 Tax=Favolaschia claudopus TaxID=2862362 RepID=A0AAW0A6U8_9AGAR